MGPKWSIKMPQYEYWSRLTSISRISMLVLKDASMLPMLIPAFVLSLNWTVATSSVSAGLKGIKGTVNNERIFQTLHFPLQTYWVYIEQQCTCVQMYETAHCWWGGFRAIDDTSSCAQSQRHRYKWAYWCCCDWGEHLSLWPCGVPDASITGPQIEALSNPFQSPPIVGKNITATFLLSGFQCEDSFMTFELNLEFSLSSKTPRQFSIQYCITNWSMLNDLN